MLVRTLLFSGFWLALVGVVEAQTNSANSLLSIDQLLEIRHPFLPTWSPDGNRVAFVWDEAGAQNVYVLELSDGDPPAPIPLTSYAPDLLEHPGGGALPVFWSGDRSIVFTHDGQLWRVPADASSSPLPVWENRTGVSTEALSLGAGGSGYIPSRDGTRFAFCRAGDLWIRDLESGHETRLTNTPAFESGPVWSPDDSQIAFIVIPTVRYDETYDYVGAKISFSRMDGWRSKVSIVSAEGARTVEVGTNGSAENSPRWLGTNRLCFQRLSHDLTSREIVIVNVDTGRERVLHRDVDDKWWSLNYLGADPLPSPDGKWIAFLSDMSGWDHLYVVAPDGGEARQITSGDHEVAHIAWSPDSKRIAFSINDTESPGTRHLAVANFGSDGKVNEITTLTHGRGTNIAPVWSPNGRYILYQHTDSHNSADFFTIDTNVGQRASPLRLTHSMPEAIDRSALIEPQFIRYASPDGQQVPAYLFISESIDQTQRHPAVVWIHGDGINQNYDGWHVHRNYAVYYSFHQYLAQRGYVVLAVDYRGSIGYGKDWRQGHFRDLGGKDYEDVAAGMDFLKSLGFVDSGRVGVWGLSYGGFLTLQALTVTPQLFRCGIDVAGVGDWRTWYKDPGGPWIHGRMGNPENDPRLYQRTASIEFAERIERPLMVLHGTADVNVPFTESVRLVDVLTKLGKNFEFVMYPGEFHYFHRRYILRDAWRRVEHFFDEHLRAESQ
jgi:dipeptidyl aminopeptidase/acylaminoacyl peptidase